MNVQIPLDRYLAEFAEPAGYLDFARFGPISSSVAEGLSDSARLCRVGGEDALDRLDGAVRGARVRCARLLEAAEHEIAFVSSTSHGLFAAASALGGRRGVVLVPRSDFPANVYPWLRVAAGSAGLTVRFLDAPPTPDSVRAALDPGVIAVALCAVDAATGARAELGEIKEVIGGGRVLVVDAVQGLGAVGVDVGAADVLASGAQKWLRRGWGAAALLVRDRVAGLLEPRLGGWSGVRDPLDGFGHPHPALPGAIAHTLTNPDGPAVDALGRAVGLVLGVGLKTISDLIHDRLAVLLDAARTAGAEVMGSGTVDSGIGLFRLPDADQPAVHGTLQAAGISCTLRNGWIRLSPHASTDPAVADTLAEAIRTFKRH